MTHHTFHHVEVLNKQRRKIEGDEGGYPGEDYCVDCREDGPFPAAAFLLDGDEGCDSREIEKDEDHVGQGTCRGHGLDKSPLQTRFCDRLRCCLKR